jgi:rare lipoprotein A
MLKNLRIFGFLGAAALLWTSAATAANQAAKTHKKVRSTKSNKMSYMGTASWYGAQHQGRKMANGKRFDLHELTAASWSFPLGTPVRVENLKNGQSVIVTITDRGPNHRLHRLLDLSQGAAERLDYVGQGLTTVLIYPVVPVETEGVAFDSPLSEPRREKRPVEYQAMALDPEM